ncbi:GMC oxidoreductase [Irpex rosettiformis]|uniref:GMC oxidoreductase n=1 Tax=Irpex rosettiformis TaxID=378272 RepID=A0ACB8U4P7_9APHY|nr:GMC oxidoreductase [Irpex rosettiformis]
MSAKIEDVANQFFDFVILGGGTAGLTLAARLSEDPARTVLVLEGGAAHIDVPDISRPASYGSHFANTNYSYEYKVSKQEFAGGRELVWQRGKGLGGSSGINFLCWLKPSREDIDAFGALGNPGWSWENYQRRMQNIEGFSAPSEDAKQNVNLKFDTIGKDGPLKLQFPNKIDEAEQHIQQASLILFTTGGIRWMLTYEHRLSSTTASTLRHTQSMSGDPQGFFFAPVSHDQKSQRSYSTTAFYVPNKDRENLSVLVNASVRKVHTATSPESNLIATGVEFEYEGNVYDVNARKEVIISSGALGSPHILELSGIGSKDVLEKAGVPMKLDLPGVGENVQEHIMVGLSWELKDDVQFDTLDILRDPETYAKHLELHKTVEGVFTTGVTSFGFVTLDQLTSRSLEIYKSMEDIVAKLDPKTTPPGLLEQYKLLLERYKPGSTNPGLEFISFPGLMSFPNPPEAGKRYITLLVAVNHPWSRGTIHATSNDPSKLPEIDPHYFEQGVDLTLLLELAKRAREVANTSPMKEMIVNELNPGPKVQTDEELSGWIKETFGTVWHTSSSCSMLPKDKGGVVDHTLKVHGTINLRVVDLSVVPLHVGTHTQSTVYGIADQAADIILGRC